MTRDEILEKEKELDQITKYEVDSKFNIFAMILSYHLLINKLEEDLSVLKLSKEIKKHLTKEEITNVLIDFILLNIEFSTALNNNEFDINKYIQTNNVLKKIKYLAVSSCTPEEIYNKFMDCVDSM
jgi:hypothetical protein